MLHRRTKLLNSIYELIQNATDDKDFTEKSIPWKYSNSAVMLRDGRWVISSLTFERLSRIFGFGKVL